MAVHDPASGDPFPEQPIPAGQIGERHARHSPEQVRVEVRAGELHHLREVLVPEVAHRLG